MGISTSQVVCATAMVAAILILMGCSSWTQTTGTVLIRTPDNDGYQPEQPARSTAAAHLTYAALSANVYERKHEPVPNQTPLDQLAKLSCKEVVWPVTIKNWTRWWDFPDAQLKERLHDASMHVEIWENLIDDPQIVIAFEGTVFTSRDHWKANLRWFLRFLPRYEDHYTIAAKAIAEAFHKVVAASPHKYAYDPSSSSLKLLDGRNVRIVATGHSLGGGLAQQFAYAFVQPATPPAGPKVSEVFAFDPSPVTGWFSTANPPRDYNAKGLRINRVFEHGEILAYLRTFTSNISLRKADPGFWLYRYNVERSADIVGSHSMQQLACGLAKEVSE